MFNVISGITRIVRKYCKKYLWLQAALSNNENADENEEGGFSKSRVKKPKTDDRVIPAAAPALQLFL